MIRTKHDIDTLLVSFFISEKNFDADINEALLNWFSSLDVKDIQKTRDNAILFLRKVASKVLSVIDYPLKEREELISIFEPLELLLRTALSLRSEGENSHNVRDHLSHTVRNVLFTNYLLKKYCRENNSKLRTQLLVAAIFHDIAYPIEKLKQIAHKLGTAAFKDLLNSKGDIELELNNPDDLLEMLNHFGCDIITKLENSINSSETKTKELEKKQDTLQKTIHLYKAIVSKAIAGKGLFDAHHSISSVVLFLRPIMKHWRDSKTYQEMNLESLVDICLAMTYHDRNNLIPSIKENFQIPSILNIMRVSDELQEWDRETDSFIKDVIIVEEVSTLVTLRIILKDKKDTPCISALFIADKIKGLNSAVAEEKICVLFDLPREMSAKELTEALKKDKDSHKIYDTASIFFEDNEATGKSAQLVFNKGQVKILIKT